jgi:hypothetical protein
MGATLPKIESGQPDQSAVLRFDTRARFLLAIIIVAQFVVLIGFIVYRGTELPDSQLILGAEIAALTTVLNYFFGSSSGSVTKSASKGEPPVHGG